MQILGLVGGRGEERVFWVDKTEMQNEGYVYKGMSLITLC